MTEIKEAIMELRSNIAELEKEQRITKINRKTVNFEKYGMERTMSPFTAQERVKEISHELRLKYAAYGLLRGKTFAQVENKQRPLEYWDAYGRGVGVEERKIHPLYNYASTINSILEEYGYEMPYETEEKKDCWGKTYTCKNFKPGDCEKIVRISE